MPIEGLSRARQVSREFVTKTIPSKVEATAKEVATYAVEKAVEFSPVLSGRFAASWRITTGLDLPSIASKGKRDRSGALAEALGASSGSIAKISFGTKFTLVNAVPYANYVEYGSPTTEAHYTTRRVAQSIGGKFGRI